MQTLQVINTIRWIDSQIPGEVKELIFTYRSPIPDEQQEKNIARIINAGHMFGDAAGKISKNPNAVQVLKAFKISVLLDRVFISSLLASRFTGLKENPAHRDLWIQLGPPYQQMMSTVGAWEELTTPKELRAADPSENLLTLNNKHAIAADSDHSYTLGDYTPAQ